MHWLGSHHALRACSAFLAAHRAPLAFSSHTCRGSLQAIIVIRHPTLRRILRVEAFCEVGAVLPLSCGAPVFMSCFARPDGYAFVKGDNTTEHGASQRGRAATRLSNTERTSAHNASRPLLLTLSHCPDSVCWSRHELSFSRSFLLSPKFCQSRGT